jgi:RHS repeat-associated protein
MTAVNYLWDPAESNIVRELDDTGAVTAQYTAEPDLYGDLLSQRRNGQDSYYHYDGQGSTLALTNANGDVTDTYAYSAFGEVTSSTGSTVNPSKYVGQKGYFDESPLGVQLRARYYSPLSCRFLSADPARVNVASGLYKYVLNRPTFASDPSGLGCKVWYDCVLVSEAVEYHEIEFGDYKICKFRKPYTFCEYKCTENSKPRELATGSGGVLCDDARIPKTINYSLSQAQCAKFVPNVFKIFTETKEQIRDCSRSKCRDDADAAFALLKKSCDAAPEHLKKACELAADTFLTEAKFLCEFCNKP